MKRVIASVVLVVIATGTSLSAARRVLPPPYEIPWYSIDGGDGRSSGGTFVVTGAIGQADVGSMSGGTFSLEGGVLAAPTTAICPADTDGSGDVGVADLLALLAQWGVCPAPCPPDVNGDGAVGVADLLGLLAAWGSCP